MISLKSIVIKAFLFSIILHLLIFNVFGFHFSKRKEALKPTLNFLGSFLGKHDFNKNKFYYHFPNANLTDPQNINLSQESGQLNKNIVSEIKKPALLKNALKKSKKTIRSLTKKTTLENTAELSKDISQEIDKVEQIRLKLPDNDYY